MPSCVINGKEHDFTAPLSVTALLQQMNLAGRKVAVEKNGDIVPKSLHSEEIIAAGDVVEIVTAVGGG